MAREEGKAMSKGSARRPSDVPSETFAARWERVFGGGAPSWRPFRLPSVTEVSDEVARAWGYDPDSLPRGIFGRIIL